LVPKGLLELKIIQIECFCITEENSLKIKDFSGVTRIQIWKAGSVS